jgi:hypothetical protein
MARNESANDKPNKKNAANRSKVICLVSEVLRSR